MSYEKGRIYLIECHLNDKKYVGLTTKSLKQRFSKHISQSRREPNKRSRLHDAILVYGKENFSISLIEEEYLSKLGEREKFWISFYDTTDEEKGYNVSHGNNVMSEDTKLKLRKVRSKRVYRYNLSGQLIDSFYGATAAAITTTGRENPKANIHNALSGKQKSAYGFLWSWENKRNILEYKRCNSSKSVYCYGSQGRLIKQFTSVKDAIEYVLGDCGVGGTSIGRAAAGKINSAHGHIWSYSPLTKEVANERFNSLSLAKRGTKVCQKDKNTMAVITEFDSASKAASNVGGDVRNIHSCLNNKIKTAYGFIWDYKY